MQGTRGVRGSHPPQPPNPLAYTPRHLAAKILQSKIALEGERKQVTVLFADVKGSMDLAGQLDSEEWHAILDRFFHILNEGVHRFEGTVNQYTGDGIMALFGAPIAHEDHAHRACYAALHLRDTLKAYADVLRIERGLNFSVRMGINSGDVVVGRIGDDLRMDYTALGHTVGLAQRMEALAEAGKAMLAGPTIDIVQGYFALRDLGAMRVKGVDAPVHVAELEGVGRMRTRLDRSRARGLSKFVGREEEMGHLEAALRRSLSSRRSCVPDAARSKRRSSTGGWRSTGRRPRRTRWFAWCVTWRGHAVSSAPAASTRHWSTSGRPWRSQWTVPSRRATPRRLDSPSSWRPTWAGAISKPPLRGLLLDLAGAGADRRRRPRARRGRARERCGAGGRARRSRSATPHRGGARRAGAKPW
jgi:class 3 adenylate cyclase